MTTGAKRFYTAAGVETTAAGHAIVLDGRPVRTPGGARLALEQRRLAEAIAAEWDRQGETLKPSTMPLMQLTATAIDRVAPQREAVIAGLMPFIDTDLLCYRVEEPEDLARRQQRDWQPLLDWAARTLDARLNVTTSILPAAQPEESVRALQAKLVDYDAMALSAVQVAAANAGSLVIALALAEREIDADRAFEAAALEETFQIEEWGEDYEAADRRARLRAELAACETYLSLLHD